MQLKEPTILFGISISGLNFMNSDDIKSYIHDLFPTEPRPTRILESPVDPSRFKNCSEEDMVHIFTGKCWTDITAKSFDILNYDTANDVFYFLHDDAKRYYLPAYLKLLIDEVDGINPEIPQHLHMDQFYMKLTFFPRPDGSDGDFFIKKVFAPLTPVQKGVISLCIDYQLRRYPNDDLLYTQEHYWRPNADFSFLKTHKKST